MANLSEYPDGITRLDAYRRLVQLDRAESRRTRDRSGEYRGSMERLFARLRASWTVLRAVWRERRA